MSPFLSRKKIKAVVGSAKTGAKSSSGSDSTEQMQLPLVNTGNIF
jgi:hypothetical protein